MISKVLKNVHFNSIIKLEDGRIGIVTKPSMRYLIQTLDGSLEEIPEDTRVTIVKGPFDLACMYLKSHWEESIPMVQNGNAFDQDNNLFFCKNGAQLEIKNYRMFLRARELVEKDPQHVRLLRYQGDDYAVLLYSIGGDLGAQIDHLRKEY